MFQASYSFKILPTNVPMKFISVHVLLIRLRSLFLHHLRVEAQSTGSSPRRSGSAGAGSVICLQLLVALHAPVRENKTVPGGVVE